MASLFRSSTKAAHDVRVMLAVLVVVGSHVHSTPRVHAQSRVDSAERVLIVGGSAALGWKDDGWLNWKRGWQGGYLVRAFQQLSQSTGTRYEVFDKAIPGLNSTLLATKHRGLYQRWLSAFRPDIVVVSWGMMNDTRPRTPLASFTRTIREEIREARVSHASVWVVTPPITTASYTLYRDLEPHYVQAELTVAADFHDPAVRTFDLFHDMQAHLKHTGQSYRLFEGDAIHPNRRGHQLAADILTQQWIRQNVTL